MFMLEGRFCNWIVEHCCGSKETTAFRCRRVDSRGTYKFSFVQAWSNFIFFHLQFVACSEAKSTWLDFWGIFHSRTIFAVATQSSQHFTFFLPCVCFLASSWNNCVFMIFFVWNTCSKQRPVRFKLFNFRLLTFLFRCIVPWCSRGSNQV